MAIITTFDPVWLVYFFSTLIVILKQTLTEKKSYVTPRMSSCDNVLASKLYKKSKEVCFKITKRVLTSEKCTFNWQEVTSNEGAFSIENMFHIYLVKIQRW